MAVTLWAQRDNIHPVHWPVLRKAAQARNIPLTNEDLVAAVQLSAKKRAKAGQRTRAGSAKIPKESAA